MLEVGQAAGGGAHVGPTLHKCYTDVLCLLGFAP